MAVKASVTITISKYRDTDSITRYYKLQASTAAAPAVPTTLTPSGWSTSEPTYTSGSTNTLYYTDCIIFSDGTFQYTDDGNSKAVKSSSYEAAKEAYNKAQAAQNSINDYISKKDIIVGTQTATTRFWTGNSQLESLQDGDEILYWLPYATVKGTAGDKTTGVDMRVDSSTTKTAGTQISTFENQDQTKVWLNLTLKNGTNQTGWIPCYYGGSTRLTTHYGAGNCIRLVYRVNANINGITYTGFFGDANYYSDSNTYDRIKFSNIIKVKSAITAGQLIVSDDNGYFKLIAGSTFIIDKPILYCGTTKSAGATDSNNNYLAYPSINVRNNTNSSWTATKNLTLYLVGILNGDQFMVDSTTAFTTTIPTTDDGKYYISLGYMYSTYQIYLYPEHPIFKYVNGQFKNISQIAYEAQNTLNDILDQKSQNGGKNIYINDAAEDYFILFNQKGDTYIKNDQIKGIKALPSTYQRVEYIEVPQSAYINIGFPMSTNYSIEAKLDIDGSTTNGPTFLGEYPGYLGHCSIRSNSGGSLITLGNHRTGSWVQTNYTYENNKPFIIQTSMKPKLKCKINNNIVYEDTQNMTDFTSSYNGALFAYRYNGNIQNGYSFKGRCYYVKIFDENGILLRDFIPCYQKAEEEENIVIGMYDRVSETFFTNSGTGTFGKGKNIGDLRTDILDGDRRFQLFDFDLNGINLHADDYLADDGVHIAHKVITAEAGTTEITIDDIVSDGNFYCSVDATIEGSKITFDTALAANTLIEYQTIDETIIPYTDKQLEDYQKIVNLYTYEDNTLIYSDGNLDIEYVRKNGLDIYQTKADAQKRYKITTEKIADIEIENGEIKLTAESAKEISDENDKALKNLTKEFNEFKVTSEGVQNTLKSKGGNNLALYSLDLWNSNTGLVESNTNDIKIHSIAGRGYILNNGTSILNIPVPNGAYTISFKYKKVGSGGSATIKINDESPGTQLTKTVWEDTENETNYIKTIHVSSNNIKIEISGNSNNLLYMCDLMVNSGEIADVWTQNPNETRTDTVTIGKGIRVENSQTETYTKIDDDGTRVFNKENDEEVARFTKEGINVKEEVVREKANIAGIVIQEIDGQVWFTNIL